MDEYQAMKSPEPARAMPGASTRLSDACAALHDRLDLLAERLQPALTSDYPSDAGLAHDSESVLDGQIVEVLRAAGRVDHLLSRLVL
jgi:hypothetical protein